MDKTQNRIRSAKIHLEYIKIGLKNKNQNKKDYMLIYSEPEVKLTVPILFSNIQLTIPRYKRSDKENDSNTTISKLVVSFF